MLKNSKKPEHFGKNREKSEKIGKNQEKSGKFQKNPKDTKIKNVSLSVRMMLDPLYVVNSIKMSTFSPKISISQHLYFVKPFKSHSVIL